MSRRTPCAICVNDGSRPARGAGRYLYCGAVARGSGTGPRRDLYCGSPRARFSESSWAPATRRRVFDWKVELQGPALRARWHRYAFRQREAGGAAIAAEDSALDLGAGRGVRRRPRHGYAPDGKNYQSAVRVHRVCLGSVQSAALAGRTKDRRSADITYKSGHEEICNRTNIHPTASMRAFSQPRSKA
jgi:hypothetical protein